jgi:outer membrane protein assembly factor BamA
MPTMRFLVLASLIVSVVLPAAAQKFQPKSIQFKGDPEYSNQELMTAAGLKKGVVLTYEEMNTHSKALMDTGVFAGLTFKFDGQDLVFLLTPSDQLYPIHLINLPLAAGSDVESKLHEKFPLYHGKVPAEGGLLDEVREGLETLMASQGVKVSITAVPVSSPGSRKISAINFSILTPPVEVSVGQIDGVSADFQEKVHAAAAEAAKNPFDTDNSSANLEHAVEIFYHDRGYAAAKIHASRSGDPVVTAESIVVPFTVTVQEGQVYKVGSVHLPDGAPVTQTEVDKVLNPTAGGPVEGVRLRTLWGLLSSRYRQKGYLDCKVTPQPQFDDAAKIVNYTVMIDPGPVYHVAFVKFENVSDELRSMLIRNWQMLPGDPFDESYVANFAARVQAQDPVLRRSLAGTKAKFNVTADPQTHDVNVVIRLEKQ